MENNDFLISLRQLLSRPLRKGVKVFTFSFHFLDGNGKTIVKTFDFSTKADIFKSVSIIQDFYSDLVLVDIV